MVQTNRRRIYRIIKYMEYIRKIAIYILFTILFIILAIDITIIVRKLNTIDKKLEKIQQEQVMTNKYLYN